MAKKKKILIGNKDIVDFPDLNMWAVKAKVDTGADTSSIHVRKIKLEQKGGEQVLSCYFRPRHKTTFTSFKQKMVKSSNGISQMRYAVMLKLILFGQEYETYFTLSDRKAMTFPILLGKRFLKGKFVVDVSLFNLSMNNQITIV